jgi:hypothetical protein
MYSCNVLVYEQPHAMYAIMPMKCPQHFAEPSTIRAEPFSSVMGMAHDEHAAEPQKQSFASVTFVDRT